MLTRAPGKVVLSGAYSVFAGAPAIVMAVNRYAYAHSDQVAPFATNEVAAAIRQGHLPFAPLFDATELRKTNLDGSTQKLGLGSSAAILVASLAVCHPELNRKTLFQWAFQAHKSAQPFGSGIDVAVSTMGGIILCSLETGMLKSLTFTLPKDLRIQVFSAQKSASTTDFLACIRAFEKTNPITYNALIHRAKTAAEAFANATSAKHAIASSDEQFEALKNLGEACELSIVTSEMQELSKIATKQGLSFGPSGAGGGDIGICFCTEDTSLSPEVAARFGFEKIPIEMDPLGVTILDPAPPC